MSNQNLNLGFIGTGGITEAFVTGILKCTAIGPIEKIWLTQRSEHRSSRLAAKFEQVAVLDSNQEIANAADWLFLAVLPEQAEAVLQEIKIPTAKILVSLVAGLSVEKIRQITGVEKVHRIIPLPPVEHGLGPIPIFPACETIENLLNQIGTAVPITDEEHFSACSAASAVMATYFEFSSSVAAWIHAQGLPEDASATYATTMLQALAATTVGKDFHQHDEMSEECLTPGGLNESILFQLRETGWFDSIEQNLNRIYSRINK